MPWRVAKAAVDQVLEAPSTRPQREIIFFGGEPLTNWTLIEQVVSYANARADELGLKVNYGMTSNGVSLDPKRVEYLVENNIGIMLSIDGGEDLHNYLRPHSNPSVNSWKATKEAFGLLREHGRRVMGRATATAVNSDALEITRAIKEMGAHLVNIQMIESDDPQDPLRFSHDDLVKYTETSIRSLREDKLSSQVAQWIFARIQRGTHIPFFCGVGKNTVAVDSSGRYFVCHRVIGTDKYQVGDIEVGMDLEKLNEISGKFRVYQMLGCKSCWARYICNGLCPMDNESATGSTAIPNSMNCYHMKRLIDYVFEQYVTYILGKQRESVAAKDKKSLSPVEQHSAQD